MPSYITDELILDVIEKGLSALGENPKAAIWSCLEKDFNLDKQKVPRNIEAFQQAMQRFFGLGYNFLEALFLKYLSEATGENQPSNSSFAECILSLRMKASADSMKNVTVDLSRSTSSQLSGGVIERV